jgi:hypothetical protein
LDFADFERAQTKRGKVLVSAPSSGKDGFAVICLKLRMSKPRSWRVQESLWLLYSKKVADKSPTISFSDFGKWVQKR